MSGARLVGLVKHVHNPDRLKKYSEVTQAIEKWSRWVKEYEKATESKVPEIGTIEAVKKTLPEQLEEDLNRLQEITDFEEVKKYIDQQVQAKKEPYFSPSTGGTSKLKELAHAMIEAKSEDNKEGEIRG